MYSPWGTTALEFVLFVVFATGPHPTWALDLAEPIWWQPASCVLVHADAWHWAGNAVVLAAAGGVFEAVHGWRPTVALFAYCGVAASLSFGYFRLAGEMGRGTLVGASGAIYGLLGAHGAHLLLNWDEQPLRRAWLGVLLLCLALEVGTASVFPDPRVAYVSHALGAAHGALLGVALVRNEVVRAWERHARKVGLALSLALLLGAALGFAVRA